jgi:hypothetical protein
VCSHLSYGLRSAISRSIAALGGDSQELTKLMRRWTGEGAQILLHASNARRTRCVIVGAQKKAVFSGPISEHYLRRANRFRPWLEHEDPLLVELARQAIAEMEEAAKREALEDEGYWSD